MSGLTSPIAATFGSGANGVKESRSSSRRSVYRHSSVSGDGMGWTSKWPKDRWRGSPVAPESRIETCSRAARLKPVVAVVAIAEILSAASDSPPGRLNGAGGLGACDCPWPHGKVRRLSGISTFGGPSRSPRAKGRGMIRRVLLLVASLSLIGAMVLPHASAAGPRAIRKWSQEWLALNHTRYDNAATAAYERQIGYGKGSLSAPDALHGRAGADVRMSSAAFSGGQNEFQIDINPT